MALSLRDYQREALDSVASGFFSDPPYARQLVVLPTGTGKTPVLASLFSEPRLAAWRNGFDPVNQKILVIAHREELLVQAAETIEQWHPGLIVEIEQAERRASMFADVVVASVKSLVRRLKNFDPAQYRVVIVDEAHHVTAPVYVKCLEYFGVLPEATDKLLLGFTATPKRGDSVGLDHIFQRIAIAKDIRWMIQHGYLCRLRAFHVDTKVSLEQVKIVNGDFAVGDLSDTVNTTARNRLVVEKWRELAGDRKTIAFTVDVAHAHDLAQAFTERGIRAEPVSGQTPRDHRRELLEAFSRGDVQVVTNCGILVEGYNEPSVSCIVHARPTKSDLLYRQMSGRATRLHPGKDDALILDFVDVASRHSLVSAADLVGLPPQFDAKGKDLLKAKHELDELTAERPHLSVVGARSMNEIEARVKEIDLWQIVDPPVLQQHSTMTWATDAGSEGFRISLPVQETRDHEIIRVRPNLLSQWEAVYEPVGEAEPVAIGAAATDAEAIHLAEAWIKRERAGATILVAKNARWRKDEPTEKQLHWLRRKRIPFNPETITRGEASRLLEMAFSKSPKKEMVR